jgi:hypothetical protein
VVSGGRIDELEGEVRWAGHESEDAGEILRGGERGQGSVMLTMGKT